MKAMLIDRLDRLVQELAWELSNAIAVAIAVSTLALLALGGRVEDLYLRARGAAPTSGEVAVVVIDAQAMHLWDPALHAEDAVPRALLATLVDALGSRGVTVVALDLDLHAPAPGDEALRAAAERHGAVLAAEDLLSTPGLPRAFSRGVSPDLARAVTPAFANLLAERPGLFADPGAPPVVRGAWLALTMDRATVPAPWPAALGGAGVEQGVAAPSLAFAAAWAHRERRAGRPFRADSLTAALTRCREAGCDTLDGLPIPTEGLEAVTRLNLRGPGAEDPVPVVAASEVLLRWGAQGIFGSAGPEPGDPLTGRLVVVGRSGGSAADEFVSPYSFPLVNRADTAGHRLHAHLADALLLGRLVRPLGEGALGWLLAAALGLAALGTGVRSPAPTHAAAWLGGAVLLLAGGVATFVLTDGVSLQLGLPLGGVAVGVTLAGLWRWLGRE